MLDLKELGRKLDEALDKETAESLKEWMRQKEREEIKSNVAKPNAVAAVMRSGYKIAKARHGTIETLDVTVVLNEYEAEGLIEHFDYWHRQLESIDAWARSAYIKLMDNIDKDEFEDVFTQLDAIEYTSANLATMIDCVLGLNMKHGKILNLRDLEFDLKKAKKTGRAVRTTK